MGWEQLEHTKRLKDRAKHDLMDKSPKLKSQAAYYREQADNTDHSTRDRKLWRMLAEEIEARIEATRPRTTEELLRENESLF